MNWLRRLNRKWKTILMIALIAAVLLIGAAMAATAVEKIPDSQQAAKRWAPDGGYAQISVFYAEEAALRAEYLESFEASLESQLREAGFRSDEEENRLWASAYSASGRVTIASQRSSANVKAVGVGGDFFLFHPYQLRYGSYFSGEDLMQDRIVIDEETAWLLFGSVDVAGMQVTIGGVTHVIAGVIHRDCDLMEKRAGADQMTVYLSWDSLSRYGTAEGISCYELLLPDPVSGYAMGLASKSLGVDGVSRVAVENSERFSVRSLLKVIGDFGIRSMKTSKLILPDWENAARGWEDVLAILLVVQLVCGGVLAVIGVAVCVEGYRAGRRKKSDCRGRSDFLAL